MRYLLVTLIIAAAVVTFYLHELFPKSLFQKTAEVDQTLGESTSKLPRPQRLENFQSAPEISARSAIVIDAQTGILLYKKNPDLRHLPASTTKLMTALTALESCSFDQITSVTFVEKEPNVMGLYKGDTVTVETLLYGLLIVSANDAAYTLASSCAPSIDEFVNKMNQSAQRLGMTNSHFTNPAGFDDANQFSNAADLARLARAAVANPLISKIVTTRSTVLNDVSGTKTYFLKNINELLGKIEGIEGIKTGQTEGALEILISQTTRNNHTIVVVVLGSDDRFAESEKLIEWSFQNYRWI